MLKHVNQYNYKNFKPLKRLDIQFFAGKEQEYRQSMKAAVDKAMMLNDDPDATPEMVNKAMQAVDAAKQKLDNYLKLQGAEPSEPINAQIAASGVVAMTGEQDEHKQKLYHGAFMNAFRGRPLTDEQAAVMDDFKAAMVEGTNEDGGYIVPEDISTRIQTLRQTVDNLEQYVSVQPVRTPRGQRTLEKRADSTPLVKIAEMDNIPQTDQPKFERAAWAIDDYAGFMPISNDLLADTDQNLMEFIAGWFAKKSRATRNALILQQLETLTKVPFADYQAIKTALNVDLDPAISVTSTIFTNQDGFNYLDQLTATDGRPLLTPNPQLATQKMLFGRPVVVLSNKTIATTAEGLAPMIVGDLKEAVILWDRQQMSFEMTKVGGNAWRTNSTEVRAIEREDCIVWDEEAVVYGQIDIDGAGA